MFGISRFIQVEANEGRLSQVFVIRSFTISHRLTQLCYTLVVLG